MKKKFEINPKFIKKHKNEYIKPSELWRTEGADDVYYSIGEVEQIVKFMVKNEQEDK
jgi:hypothetical protein